MYILTVELASRNLPGVANTEGGDWFMVKWWDGRESAVSAEGERLAKRQSEVTVAAVSWLYVHMSTTAIALNQASVLLVRVLLCEKTEARKRPLTKLLYHFHWGQSKCVILDIATYFQIVPDTVSTVYHTDIYSVLLSSSWKYKIWAQLLKAKYQRSIKMSWKGSAPLHTSVGGIVRPAVSKVPLSDHGCVVTGPLQ